MCWVCDEKQVESDPTRWTPDLAAADRRWGPYLAVSGFFGLMMPMTLAEDGWVLALVGTVVVVAAIVAAGRWDVGRWRRRLTDAHLRLDGTTLHFATRGSPRSIDLTDHEIVKLGAAAPESSPWMAVFHEGTTVTVSRDRKWGPDEVIVDAFVVGKKYDELERFLASACDTAGVPFESQRVP
ncbi:hypothetical protein [Nocardioides yefusunii]|uniref:PH domain-containing protein n=1 Tax=Nocardioides yefusunii TaxID=2500546 RepID=A0ABW1QYH2_9ACTN|nr:hypothetical protein [Nocardioides yefusunii]